MATRSAAAKKPEKESKIEAPKGKGKAAAEAPKGDAPKKSPIGNSKYKGEQVVTLLVDYNPKRVKSASHGRFEHYEDGMTVAQALKAGVTAADLNWDVQHGFIEIGDEFNEDAEKKSKPEPKPRAPAKEGKAAGKTPARAKGKGKKEEEEEEEEEC